MDSWRFCDDRNNLEWRWIEIHHQEYVQGAKGYTLSIQVNGTYSWQTTEGTITGTWKAEADGRIVLLKGKYDFDWYVTKTKEDEIKFYSYGMEEFGTKMK